ncbi:MAG: PD-(D/E)XK nuclease family protein [Paraclostridium bifermentans]|uniref:PD-(D/E)XK nuclease family protein n=1 Tax=Paraclostridium bifermentans TaxID=1490 RepID=UPI001D1A7B64|nr:PD-(D/E)XK nuclease family protein [Paraclostridium bifermentans]MBS6506550.1 PD-(D/E)XK nuclease family protein [Paraclostridium bifermentans]
MNKKLENFLFSQNSINTYRSCPLKFKFKYVDKLNWKQDDEGSRDYYENLKLGSDFHLICERYFSNIPTGIEFLNNEEFNIWLEKIKRLIPIKDDKLYLPEYEVRYSLNNFKIQAKFDLVVVDKDSISIWDWKTENRKIEYKDVENRVQTLVYLFLASETIGKIYNLDIDYENIKLSYYQPEYHNEPITITYSNEKHNINKKQLENYIGNILNTNYDEEKNIKNIKHCKFCEFNKLCNNEAVNYSTLEEEIYEP